VGWRRATTLLALLVALFVVQSAQAAPVLVIDGAGDGHGVGMSQVGADGLAVHGYSARQILSHYYTGTSLERLSTGRIVTVLLQSGLPSVVFSGATLAGARRLDAASTYIAAAAPGGEIALKSSHGHLLAHLPAPLELTSPSPISFDGAASSGVIDGRYRGSLELDETASDRLDVVNRVGLESYLRGVVPVESPPTWAPAELAAQAIAARSYAVASPPQRGFDLYADTRSQEYGGYGAETAATDAAVSATVGEVVTYAGKPVATYYFASSGGQTESVQNAFIGSPSEPYLTAVLDPYDSTRFGPITMSLQAAERKLRGILHGTLESIEVTRRGASPRVVSASVVGSRGTTAVSGSTLASALGLSSTWDCFTVTSNAAHLAADWAHACAGPTPPPSGGATGPTGGGTIAPPGGTSGAGPAPTTPTGASGSTTGSGGGAVAPAGSVGTSASAEPGPGGGAVGPSG
jgi:stage II sporulation protein D